MTSSSWSLVDRLCRYGESAPERTAIDLGGTSPARLTRGDWDRRARAIAAHLRPGSRVLVLLPSGVDFFVAFSGALYAGACAVPAVPPVEGRTQFVDLALDAEVDAVVTTTPIAERARRLWAESNAPAVRWVELDRLDLAAAESWTPPRIGPEDLALLQYTSGSTGAAKGVAVVHQVLATWVDVFAERVALPAGSSVVTWVPAHHVLGLSFVLLAPELDGPATLFTPEDVLAEPMRWLRAVSDASETGHPVLSGAPPFGYQHCVEAVAPAERATLDLSAWEVAVIGSERIRPQVLDDFAEAYAVSGFRPTAYFTGYGTTEMMMGCAHRGPEPPLRLTVDAVELERRQVVPVSPSPGRRTLDLVACGPPGAGLQVIIVDPDTRIPCPSGAVGELWLRGPAVAQGYWRRPEQTEQTFGARLADGSGPYLRTGDLAFYHHEELVVCGRLSELIIIRGRNLIPQDIESSVRGAAAGVAEAPVAAFPVEGDDGEALVVVVAASEPSDAQELLTTIRRAVVAGHEVDPHAVLMVEPGEIPLTATGKVRHRAARQAYLDNRFTPYAMAGADADHPSGTGPDAVGLGPGDRAEAVIRTRIAQLTESSPQDIPVDEPLVRLGLDSMAMIKLRARLTADLNVTVSMERLAGFTVAALIAEVADPANQDEPTGAAVGDSHNGSREQRGPAGRRQRCGTPERGAEAGVTRDPEHRYEPFPLTELQHAYLVGRSGGYPLGGVGTHYYAEFDTRGIDLDRLHAAWSRLVERHDMLRAVVSGEGEQTVLPSVVVPPFPIRDLSQDSAGRAAAGTAEVREQLSHQVFGPDSWPLYEIRVTRLPDGIDRVHVSLDLLVLDVWSLHVLSREWRRLYEQPEADLAPLEVTFRDYVLAVTSVDDPDAERYWLDRLDTLPRGPDLPLRRSPASLTGPPSFRRRSGRLGRAQWTNLTALAGREGLTPTSVLLAAYATVLGAWSRRSRFTLNLPTFNRLPIHEDIDSVIGDFTSVTLLEVDLEEAAGLAGLAKRLQGRLWRDLEHRAHSGVRVLREVARRRGPDDGIFAPVVFSSASGQSTDTAGGLPLSWLGEQVFGVSQTPQVVLDHQLIENDGGLEYNWDTVDEVFSADAVENMFDAYRALLDDLAADDRNIWHGTLPALLPAEHRDVIEAANSTAAPLPDGLLHDRLVAQAERDPDRPAIFADDAELTFGELHRHAAALATSLVATGLRPNELVAVSLPKGATQVVAVLGVLLAGGAYLPVDPELPRARQRRLAELGGCALVVCGADAADGGWPDGVTPVVPDLDRCDVPPVPPNLAAAPAQPGDLAYVIFTSGSTGEPKGVAVSHRAAVNTCVDVCERFEVGCGDRVLGLSSLSFDLSVWDVFGVLGAGGALVLPRAQDHRDPGRWLELVREHGVTVWNSVPALAQMYADYPRVPGIPPDPLRLVLLSGDWIPVDLPGRLRAAAPGCRVVSLGGATEAAIWSICYEVGEVDPAWDSIPYGRPLNNQRFHVFNDRWQECPVHVTGELYIGGTGLAEGYYGDPERTAAAFVHHPETGERLYRTGDLGRWRPDGRIEFLGREDFQVKVGGYRIELGEIENAITAHPGVSAAVVAALGERHHRRLAACVIPRTARRAGPRTAGRLSPEAVDPAERDELIFDELERVEFKVARHGVRNDLTGNPVPLDGCDTATPTRSSQRRYADRLVSLRDLSTLLSCLHSHDVGAMPKYAYASAGNSYAVQTYLHVADGKVDGLPGGTYYHDPAGHRLVSVNPGVKLSEKLLFGADQHALDTAAFTLFLIADLSAVRPLYGARAARDLCLIEAGLMSQLLEDNGSASGIGLCQLTTVGGESTLREPFRLGDEHEVLHAVLGGALLRAGERQADPDDSAADDRLLESVHEHIAARLPGYMIPATMVTAERLPLTPTGKVDRGALESLVAASSSPKDSSPPTGALETRIAEVFGEVLGIDDVGGEVRFFDLGADSTAIVRAYRLLQARLGQKFPLTAMFEYATVRGLAGALSERRPDREGSEQSRRPGPDGQSEKDERERGELLAAARRRAGLARAARQGRRSSRRIPATQEETS